MHAERSCRAVGVRIVWPVGGPDSGQDGYPLCGGNRRYAAGLSSTTDGFTASSGNYNVSPIALNRVSEWPFSSPFTATVDVGDIDTAPTFNGTEGPATWNT